MTKRELVAPPVGTIYQVRRHGWRADLLDNEYWQVERRTEKTVWLRQVTTVEAFVLRTFDFARIPVQGGFVNDTIIPCRLHKDGGLYVRGHQVRRYHGEVHDPRYGS